MNSTSTTRSVEQLGYTIAQACEAIPCSRTHLYRAIRKGYIRVARDGKKVLISRQAIIDYLERGDGRDSAVTMASEGGSMAVEMYATA
ncbi:MAG TPA: helix-turn-helix domain-containing protein [Acidimicrobiales bacterium]